MKTTNPTSELALETIVTNAIQIPGVKVDRNQFLSTAFANEEVDLEKLLTVGPVEAGCSREMLLRMANKRILAETSKSSAASFAMGLPGGVAMGVTIPADLAQFFGMSLRLAQELSYLFGAKDLWQDGEVDNDAVRGQLVLYCGVMFGVSGAAAGVRLLSTRMAGTLGQKVAQQALTKTVWYPIVKQVGKAVGIKVTKNTVAKGVTKAVPVIGGVISGTLNFASMMPMAKRLLETLDQASFQYTEAEIVADYEEIQRMADGDEGDTGKEPATASALKNGVGDVAKGLRGVGAGVAGLVSKAKQGKVTEQESPGTASEEDVFTKLEKLQKLKEMGVITQEEFEGKKAELLAKI